MNDLPVGDPCTGAEIYISRLADSQRKAGDDVLLFSARRHHRGVRRLLDVWDPKASRQLREMIASEAPDVVHFHNVIRELSPSVLAAAGTTPAVATVHDLRAFGGIEHHLPDPRAVVDRILLGPLVRRELRRRVALLVAVSEAARRHLRNYGFENVEVARVPVPAPPVPPMPVEECNDVVFVGRLGADKGVEILLEAFGSIAGRFPAARLVLVGDGPLRDELEVTARTTERVVLTGLLDQTGVSFVMGRARVVVTPSIPALRPEGSSLTTAEAARHGRPVVTSDDPAVAEVASIVGGAIVPAGDAGALAVAVGGYLGDSSAAVAAGERARAAAADVYDVDSIRARMDSLYLSVAGQQG